MNMAKKTNLKSVRISDEVLTYIENFEGNGFNQKFENLVLFCMREEKRKRIEIQNLDNLINLWYKKDRAIFDLQREAALTIKQLISMQHDLEKLQKYMNIIRAPADPANPADNWPGRQSPLFLDYCTKCPQKQRQPDRREPMGLFYGPVW